MRFIWFALPLLRLEVHGHEPLPQRKLGVVEDRPRGHREAVAASVAIELVPSGDLGYGHVTATRAGDTRRPAQLFEVFPAGLFGSERSINDIRLAVLDMVDSTKRREKDRLPKDVSKLTGDEIMQKVFSKRVVKELKRVAQESERAENR